jgi:ATP-grasp domain
MTFDGVLILSHCGFSFAEDLIAAIRARDLQPFVLSSKPLAEHGENRLQMLRESAEAVLSSDSHVLDEDDVVHALASLRASGYTVKACISVWEGYRVLMAHANALLGVSDLAAQRADRLRNKLFVRNELRSAGLSGIDARLVTPDVLDELKRDGVAYFIKPVQGIASYGAFRLSQDTTWSVLDSIAKRAQEDTVYASALGEHVKFLAEDYVAGTEFSFEVLVAERQPFVVGIHEKCELTETRDAVLENSCTSPPASLTASEVSWGMAWLRAVFDHLALDWGCYHVEARFDGKRWELIEINPRVGGSLISHSVKTLNGEASVLELWLDLLLQQTAEHANVPLKDTLTRLAYSVDGTPPTARATFFRVYFASPGLIDSIEIRPVARAPAIKQVLLKPGDVVVEASREVFLGQLLWEMTREERDAELSGLLEASASAIDVQYQTSSIVLEA